ncbi:hypothetical protein [Primorskyibacter sp. S187A]|uniref:hypothetical protein n=1 Tax=Primorskyibacter sp. S187A TaxID=3415130 RepID=UPI003C7D8671
MFKNTEDVADAGVVMPKPSSYRKLLSSAVNAIAAADPAPDAREVLLDAILGSVGPGVDRLVLSHESFFTVPKMALGSGVIYPRAGARLADLQRLFPGDRIELFIGLRNPATWLPAVFDATPHDNFAEFLNGCDAAQLRWSEMIQRLRMDAPDVPITVWCNEDTPLIWGQIARELMGLDPGVKIKGAFDLLTEIMSADGMKRFRAYLHKHQTLTEVQKRRVMVAFLDKFALEEAVEEELDIPGWTDEYVDWITNAYDEDIYQLSRIPGVSVIQP